jgi:hypothetical protein
MEGVDRENSFSAGVAQPDGNRNHGVVVLEGEILALTTWKEERKEVDVCNRIELHYFIWQSGIPFRHMRILRVSAFALFVYVRLPNLGNPLTARLPRFPPPRRVGKRPCPPQPAAPVPIGAESE